MNNETEFIYGLAGITFILLSWLIIISVKLFKKCRITRQLLKQSENQRRQRENKIKKQTCKNCNFNNEEYCTAGTYYAKKGLNKICYEGELWEMKLSKTF